MKEAQRVKASGEMAINKNENRALKPSREQIAAFCERHHIRKLSLFGSVLREDFRPESDVDVLVEFQPGCVPGYFRLFDLEQELSGLFGGRTSERAGENRKETEIVHGFSELSCDGPPVLSIADSERRGRGMQGGSLEKKRTGDGD